MAKKKSKKDKKKRLSSLILLLLLTTIMLSTATYAWFTANKTVTVSTVDVSVTASSGLQISVDGTNWKSVITNDDLQTVLAESSTYPENNNQLPAEALSPVSSVGGINAGEGTQQMFLGSVGADEESGEFKLTAETNVEQQGTGGHFVVFDFFFQVQNETNIYLTNKSKVSAGDTDTGIQNAARVSFLLSGNAPAGSPAATVQALNDTTANSGKAKIWEPNADTHKDSAITHALNTYSKTIENNDSKAVEYYGVKADIGGGNAQALDSTNETYFEKVTPISTYHDGISGTQYQELFTLSPGITKVRIYMWIEGQDVDCEDNESGGDVKFDLQFSIDDGTGGE